MKKGFVVWDVLKYISGLLILFFGLFSLSGKNPLWILILFLLALCFALGEVLSIRAKSSTSAQQTSLKETRSANQEAACRRDDQEMDGIREAKIEEFIHKITTIRNELNAKNDELAALQEVSQIITSTFEVKIILEYIYSVFSRFTGCDRYMICFPNKETNELYVKYEFGRDALSEQGSNIKKSSIIHQSYQTRTLIKAVNIFIETRGINGDKIAIPLNAAGDLVGVLFVESGKPGSFENLNMEFLENLAVYAAIAVKNADLFYNIYHQKQEIEALYEETTAVNAELNNYNDALNQAKEELNQKNEALVALFNEMKTGYLQTVMALANSIEAKDSYTRGHCQRVMEVACEIAVNMGMPQEDIGNLKYAAILHDIGKIGIPAAIINKNGKLTDSEIEEIKKHPIIAYNILKDVEFLRNGLDGILQHHERIDGTGYPYGLKGEEICVFGKILCIAETFDAMTSDRPYRKGMEWEDALAEIERCKGTQFDEEITDVFLQMSRKLKITT